MDEKDARHFKSKKNLIGLLYFRGIFLAAGILFFLLDTNRDVVEYSTFESLIITVSYNVFAVVFTLRNHEKAKVFMKFAYLLDTAIIALLAYHFGGIHSDIYLLLIFVVGYYGFFENFKNTVKINIIAAIFYTFSCYLASRAALSDLNIWKLAVRDLFLIGLAYGIHFINCEVRKYDELHRKEFKLARTDKLTGLANRHYFDQKIAEEIGFADESGKPLNVLIFDLDNFKKFNDTYGHTWGDKLLMLFSDIIKQNIRKTDIPVRFGGEEFLVLIRELDMGMAKSVGDRIRGQLEKQKIFVGNEQEKRRVTVSCGLAQYPRHSSNIKQVIDFADKALYHAKETGKNKVVSYDEIK